MYKDKHVSGINTTCHDKYLNLILPKESGDFTFEQTIKKLGEIFGASKTIFNRRFQWHWRLHNLCWTYQSKVRIIWSGQYKSWWNQMFNFCLWIEMTYWHWNKNELTVFISKWCWKEINCWKTPSRLSKSYQS